MDGVPATATPQLRLCNKWFGVLVILQVEFRKAHGSSHVVKQAAPSPREGAELSFAETQPRDRRSTMVPISNSKRGSAKVPFVRLCVLVG